MLLAKAENENDDEDEGEALDSKSFSSSSSFAIFARPRLRFDRRFAVPFPRSRWDGKAKRNFSYYPGSRPVSLRGTFSGEAPRPESRFRNVQTPGAGILPAGAGYKARMQRQDAKQGRFIYRD